MNAAYQAAGYLALYTGIWLTLRWLARATRRDYESKKARGMMP